MITIRPELPTDDDAIERLVVAAFEQSEIGHSGEAGLVAALRKNCSEWFALVASDDQGIVGHLAFSPVTIHSRAGELNGMGLAPISVVPNRQRQGIGAMLIREGLDRLAANNCPFVVVLGHPNYYQRFGFLPAIKYGIEHGFVGIPQSVFFIRVLNEGSLVSFRGGKAIYHSEFGAQDG